MTTADTLQENNAQFAASLSMMQWPQVSNRASATSSSGSLSPNSNQTSTSPNKIQIPNQTLTIHPVFWSREDVQDWLQWCINEYSFTDVQIEKFSMNGKALLLLNKEDFVERAPYAGAVLYHVLQKLVETQQNKPGSSGVFPPRTLSALTSSIASSVNGGVQSSPVLQATSRSHSTSELNGLPGTTARTKEEHFTVTSSQNPVSSLSVIKSTKSPTSSYPHLNNHSSNQYIKPDVDHLCGDLSNHRPKTDCRLLWEFISKLLQDPSYSDYIRWENQSDYTFRIINPAQLSKLWGIQKNRTNMTYEKLSRALRYYYRMDIIEKVPGRRLTYRFMRPPQDIKRGQRGARPGVPRKYRTEEEDYEQEDLDMEAYENGSDISDERTSPSPSLPQDLSLYPRNTSSHIHSIPLPTLTPALPIKTEVDVSDRLSSTNCFPDQINPKHT